MAQCASIVQGDNAPLRPTVSFMDLLMQQNENMSLLANQKLPLAMHSFAVGADGRLVKQVLSRIAFHFIFDGLTYHAIALQGEDAGFVEIYTDLGGIPYSAEGVARRVDVAEIIYSTRDLPSIRVSVTDKQHVILSASAAVDNATESQTILATVSMLVIKARPWLTLLALYGLPNPRQAAA
jgi:hypothetical protein